MKKRILSLISLCMVATLLLSVPVMAAESNNKNAKATESSEKSADKKKAVHTVTFRYGTKTKVYEVEDGDSVDPPTDTFVQGFVFVNWSAEATNVKKDMIILGGYRPTLGEVMQPLEVIPYVSSIVTSYNTSNLKYNNNTSAGWPVVWATKYPDLVQGTEGETCCVHWYNGLTGELWKTDVVKYGTSIPSAIADPYIQGYEFVGWEGSWVNVTDDRTISAHFEPVYTVTYVDTVTNYAFTSKKARAGSRAELPEPPTHDGYSFCYYSGNGDNILGDTVLYAVYERIPRERDHILYEDDDDNDWY